MQVPLELVARDVPLRPALKAAIQKSVDHLEQLEPRLIACRVVVTRGPGRHRQRFQYRVRLDLTVPRREFPVTRTTGTTALAAAQAAFETAERRLREETERRNERGRHPRARPPRARVRTIYPTAGYGFLETDDGRQIYFDARSVLDGAFSRLEPGTEVKFREEAGRDGPQASTVSL